MIPMALRIVIVSSMGHKIARGGIKFDDITFENDFHYFKAYGHSKLANILHGNELANRLVNTGISVYSLHPGAILTDLGRDLELKMPACLATIFKNIFGFCLKTPFHGAQTTLYCLLEDKIEHESGNYYSGCSKVNPSPQAQNAEASKKLWELSEKLVGLKEDV